MSGLNESAVVIRDELLGNDSEVRAEFASHFSAEIEAFAVHMGRAVDEWQMFDVADSQDRALVSAIVYCAITLNIMSLKLFLSGHIVVAGNCFRQGLEAIALALLCSDKDLPMRQSFIVERYSSKNAIRDVCKHRKRLGLLPGTEVQLRDAEVFYGNYSHVTMLTVASTVPLAGEEVGAYVGSSFDSAKIHAYRKEVGGRVSLSSIFVNFIQAVKFNVAKWS